MKLTIVYDNELFKKGIGLLSDWGFSCLIETDYETILFDTGAKGEILLSNMRELNINSHAIGKIVLSHDHWDHSGGLAALADSGVKATIFQTSNRQPDEKLDFVSVIKPMKISGGVYTTGSLVANITEQSLILKGANGWHVLVGCSHPGVERILDAAKPYGKIVGLIGGVHGFHNFSILEKLNLISVCHCTKYKKEIQKLYPKICEDCGVGKTFEL